VTQSEKDFSSFFEDALRLYGWRFFHQRPAYERGRPRNAQTGDPGFPDYVCAKNGRVLFVELKSDKGRVSPNQRAWLDAIMPVDSPFTYVRSAHVFRPKDWDAVVELLSA